MKDVFLVYDKSCFYEIEILNYFMSFSHCDMVFCSLDGKPVRAGGEVVSASLNETRDFDCRDLCRSRCTGSRRDSVRCEINPFLRCGSGNG